MKPSEDQIKQALLHSDQIVRDAALQYFTFSFSRDRSIMPVVTQAIEKYDWEQAFRRVSMLQNLPQTDDTLLWLIGQLDGPQQRLPSDVERICSIISHAEAEVLGRHESRLEECRWLKGNDREAVRQKIQLLSVSGETCWKELEELCQQHKDDESDRFDFGRANRLVEATSREGDRHASRVLSILSVKIETPQGNPLVWLEIFMAKAAGMMRLESASSLLVAKLKDDDSDFMNEECTCALTKIGDAALEAIAKDFYSAPSHYRLYASSALQDMRGEKVVAKALELLKGPVGDWDIEAKFIGAALANFDTEGLRVATEIGVDDLPELRKELIATAMLTGESFPDLERLREEDREHLADGRRRQEWLLGAFQKAATLSAIEKVDEPVVQPIKTGRKIGRNDPCPCGSGKKYKKCCMAKDAGR